jgi:hypothetical protein
MYARPTSALLRHTLHQHRHKTAIPLDKQSLPIDNQAMAAAVADGVTHGCHQASAMPVMNAQWLDNIVLMAQCRRTHLPGPMLLYTLIFMT